jgi:hypothetical protein
MSIPAIGRFPRASTATIRRSLTGALVQVGPREFEGILATSTLQEDGFALLMAGGDMSRLTRSGPLLLDHNPAMIVGVVMSVSVGATSATFRARFAAAGVSARADEAHGLLKDGVLNQISLGFVVDEVTPIDPNRPRGPQRATAWRALEVSLVAVGMDEGARVTARANRPGRPIADLTFAARQARVAALAQGAHMTATERYATVLELTPQPPVGGNPARHVAEMREYLAADAMHRNALRMAAEGPSREERLLTVAALRLG